MAAAASSTATGMVQLPDRVERTGRVIVTRSTMVELGVTRWASPPPGTSWKTSLVLMLIGDAGLLLLAWGLGAIGGGS